MYFWESCRHVFESKNVTVFSVVMATLLYHRPFAVIPLLRGNSDALGQSHLRNFSAHIINLFMSTRVERLSLCVVLKAKHVRIADLFVSKQ